MIPKVISVFLSDETGATAIEYALIVTFISIALIAALGQLGTSLKTGFTKVTLGLNN